MPSPEIFVGLTTWNSDVFLGACLDGLRRTLANVRAKVLIFDNGSTDRTQAIAQEHGIEFVTGRGSQPYALNRLIRASSGRFTLLMHSDVVLLNPRWTALCTAAIDSGHALVSPEDIGFGPWTRPWGRGMPESSFMFWRTSDLKSCRAWRLLANNRFGLPIPQRELDLSHLHVTHHLPRILASRRKTWLPMKVHASPVQEDGWTPNFDAATWQPAWGHYRYAFGNFYSLNGEVTHYHNWYDRVSKDIRDDSEETCEANGKGIPLAFMARGTRTFLADYWANEIRLPDPHEPTPEPRSV